MRTQGANAGLVLKLFDLVLTDQARNASESYLHVHPTSGSYLHVHSHVVPDLLSSLHRDNHYSSDHKSYYHCP